MSAPKQSAVALAAAVVFVVVCSFVCHSAAKRRNLLLPLLLSVLLFVNPHPERSRTGEESAVACSLRDHSASQRRQSNRQSPKSAAAPGPPSPQPAEQNQNPSPSPAH